MIPEQKEAIRERARKARKALAWTWKRGWPDDVFTLFDEVERLEALVKQLAGAAEAALTELRTAYYHLETQDGEEVDPIPEIVEALATYGISQSSTTKV